LEDEYPMARSFDDVNLKQKDKEADTYLSKDLNKRIDSIDRQSLATVSKVIASIDDERPSSPHRHNAIDRLKERSDHKGGHRSKVKRSRYKGITSRKAKPSEEYSKDVSDQRHIIQTLLLAGVTDSGTVLKVLHDPNLRAYEPISVFRTSPPQRSVPVLTVKVL
jgi:hypothetical protein